MVLVAGQKDTGGLGRASGHVDAEPASKLSVGGFFGAEQDVQRVDDRPGRLLADRPFTGLVLLQLDRQVAAALADLLGVDAGAGRRRRR